MSIEVLERGELSLTELADAANREHELVIEAGSAMINHAILAGEALLTIQAKVPRGSWMQWLRSDRVRFSTTTAALYMRLARYRDIVQQSDATTITDAHSLLIGAGVPNAHKGGLKRLPAWYAAEAKRLCGEDGLSAYACAKELGVSPHTVQRWVDPAFAKRDNEASARRKAEKAQMRRLAKEQEQQRRIKQAVKKAGAATAEAYAMAERMQDVIAQAQREQESRDNKRKMSRAGELQRQMRDLIVEVLGVTS